MANQVECQKCGWCCRTFPINIAYSDLLKWIGMGRKDILREISFIDNYPKKGQGGFYVAKTTFNPKQPCPFLTAENQCNIHEIKPITCKNSPTGRKRYEECYLSQYRRLSKKEEEHLKHLLQNDFQQALNNKDHLLNALILARE